MPNQVPVSVQSTSREPDRDGTDLHLRAVFRTMTEGVVVQAADSGAIIDWNPAAERILGLTGDQLAGRSSMDPMWQAVDRSGAPLSGDQHPSMRALAAGAPVSDVFGVRTGTGSLRWVSVHAAPVRDEQSGAVTAVVATFSDVTESLEVQARHALAAASVGTWTWYPASDAVRWSSEVGPLLGRPAGWSPQSFAEFLEIVHPDDRRRMLDKLDAALRTGSAYDPRYRVRWPDGSWHWLQGGEAWAERAPDGSVLRMDAAVWDVTDVEENARAAAAQHAEAMQARRELEAAFSTMSDAFFAVNREWIITHTTPRAHTLLQREGVELVGQNLWEAFPEAVGSEFERQYRQALAKSQAVAFEAFFAPFDRWYEVRALPGERGLGVFFQDVSERRRIRIELEEAETRYRRLVDESPDGVFVHVGPHIQFVNAAGAKLLGASAIDLKGRTLLEFVVPEEQADLVERMQRSAETGSYGVAEQTLVRQDTGERIVVEVSAVPTRFLIDGTSVDAVQATVRNITERRRAERERAALEERLRHTQKLEAVGQLAGGLAHDLNNMLQVISGNRELVVAEMDDTHPASPFLDEMITGIDSAQRLVQSLLIFSRRESLQLRDLDMTDIVRRFLPLMRTAVGERVSIVTNLPVYMLAIRADRSHIEQILMNLVLNARDALLTEQHGRAPSGGVISVALSERTIAGDDTELPPIAPGRFAELVVGDNGHGMAPDVVARVFEPFFTTKDVGKGTGIGLSTVFGIVQRMGGHIEVHSEPAVGTRVRVLLPVQSDSDGTPVTSVQGMMLPTASHLGSRASDDDMQAEVHALSDKVVLLAEDEASVRRLTRRMLERAGARVLEAADGEEALLLWAKHKSDIAMLVTDVRMPKLGGVELAHRLRAEREHLPVVLVSGYVDGQEVHDWNQRLAFVAKPFELRDLLQAVETVLT